MPDASRPRSTFFVGSDRDGRVAAVDVQYLAGDRAREIREQERGDVADFVDRDAAVERRPRLETREQLAEVADAGGGERLDRERTAPR